MRKLKHPLPEMITAATTFEAGANRSIIISIEPNRICLRAKGCKERHVISYGAILLHACGIKAGFDPSPSRRLVRGGV